MTRTKISTIVSLLLLSNTFVFADSTSISEAFKKGTTSGDITIYYENTNSEKVKDSGISAGSIGLNYQTDSFNEFSTTFGFRAHHKLYEKAKGVDYQGAFGNSAIMNIAALKYTSEKLSISIGRQEIDLEWLGDFNEAIVTNIKSIQDTSIVVGYTNRQTEIGIDTSEDFKDINENKGLYVLDIKNNSLKNIAINPYFYSAPNLTDIFGIKTSYDNDVFGITAHYARSSEDTQKDGSIYNVEARSSIKNISLAAGYIGTDKDIGAGNMSTFGDNISPFDDGEEVYSADAQTIYASASYSMKDLALTAILGKTKFSSKKLDANELNIIIEYSITSNFNTELTYVNYDVDQSDSNYEKVYANVSYSF